MTVPLDEVVPWGRSFDEYRRMFDLTRNDLDSMILGCGDGPASFNAEMAGQGKRVVSVDPIYCYSASQIEARIADVEVVPTVRGEAPHPVQKPHRDRA